MADRQGRFSNLGNRECGVIWRGASKLGAPLTFVGDGGVDGVPSRYVGRRGDWSTGEIDVKGKAVLLAADLPGAGAQQTEPRSSVRSRIEEAARRGAAAAILFSIFSSAPGGCRS